MVALERAEPRGVETGWGQNKRASLRNTEKRKQKEKEIPFLTRRAMQSSSDNRNIDRPRRADWRETDEGIFHASKHYLELSAIILLISKLFSRLRLVLVPIFGASPGKRANY